MQKKLILAGSLSGLISVAFGAFGAHYLKSKLEPAQLDIFETAVRYQFYHSLAILIAAVLISATKESKMRISGNLFIAGIILFSGSLYVMTACYLFSDGPPAWIGPVTPLGGLCFMAGWLTMFLFTYQQKSN
jgi:uncharacterized membrane protein YgdD (TMEM256/DUF423 family)